MPIGIILGAYLSSRFSKESKRSVFIKFNVLGIVACLVSCINTYITVIIGRFVYGVVGGIMISITPKMLQETIPKDIYNKGYGATTNFVL